MSFERKVWFLAGWVERNQLYWALHLNPTYEYQAITKIIVSVSKTKEIMRQEFSFMQQITIADYVVVTACYVCTIFVAQH